MVLAVTILLPILLFLVPFVVMGVSWYQSVRCALSGLRGKTKEANAAPPMTTTSTSFAAAAVHHPAAATATTTRRMPSRSNSSLLRPDALPMPTTMNHHKFRASTAALPSHHSAVRVKMAAAATTNWKPCRRALAAAPSCASRERTDCDYFEAVVPPMRRVRFVHG